MSDPLDDVFPADNMVEAPAEAVVEETVQLVEEAPVEVVETQEEAPVETAVQEAEAEKQFRKLLAEQTRLERARARELPRAVKRAERVLEAVPF